MKTKPRHRLWILLPAVVLLVACVWTLAKYLHLPSFHVVEAGRLYRSGQPVDEFDWERLKHDVGVRTVVNLRPWEEGRGRWKDEELAETAEDGIRILHLPMRDTAVPTPAQADRFLAWVRNAENWPVLVHCKAGKDRTGTVVALYRIHVQGWSVAEALEELRRIDDFDPLNEGVEEFLRTYKPGPASASQPAAPRLRGLTDAADSAKLDAPPSR